MRKMLFAVALLSFAFAANLNAQAGNGWLSRYWDGCKPSCSWSGKQYNGQGQCKECNQQNQKITTSDQNRSSCDGGTSYTCWDMSPWAVDANTAYGFAAAHRDNQCGTCWELTFDGGFQHGGAGATHQALKGKKLTVMISNIGGDVNGNQLDFLVPGGGLGQFDSFSGQIGVSKSALGETYGGLLAALGNPTAIPGAQTQLKGKCADVFGGSGKEWLKAGCDFYADWMMAANNPTYSAKSVTCPAALADRWKNAATGTPGGTPGGNPTPTTYTLTVSRNNNNGGSVSPTSQSNIAAGTAVNISATPAAGYTFQNWVVSSGTATIASASSAATTVTLSSNATITANFQQQQQTTTYTLTVSRNPANGGATTPASSQSNIAAGTAVPITATPAAGYRFVNWTGGTGTFGNANSATTTVTVNQTMTITANFAQEQQATTYTLTVNPSPQAGGTVSPTSQANIASGARVAITATAATGYSFQGWVVSSGTANIENVNQPSTGVYLSSNAAISANFQLTGGGNPTTYTLTVNRSPQNGGSTTPATSQSNIAAGTDVPITATAASGYTFLNWTGPAGTTFGDANSRTTTVKVNSAITITANFQQQTGGGGGCAIPADRTYIVKIEAENYTSQVGDGMKTTTQNGITNIGYIENGYSATYNNVSAAQAGSYSMRFRLATEMSPSDFTVEVNGQNAGSVSLQNTGSWDTYQMVTLCANNSGVNVPLNKGNNTVVLRFGNAVNVDYFELLGAQPDDPIGGPQSYTLTVNRTPDGSGSTNPAAPQSGIAGGTQFSISAFPTPGSGYVFDKWVVTSGVGTATIADPAAATTTVTLADNATITANFVIPSGVRHYGAARANGRTRVSLTPAARGFNAALPAGHGYTSYTLVDLRGREIRSGKIGAGVTDLRFSNLNRSVMFLRLEGKGGSPLVLKAVTY
jgi:hypothetical protein